MLPKINRLTKKKDFERVFKEGKKCNSDFLFCKFFKNNLDVSRFGLIVSQKVSKKATIRNRIKRQIREAIRLKLPKIQKGFDVIFIVKPNIKRRSFSEILEKLEKILKEAKLIKNENT